ncbi:hypothetical protein CDAR_403951 [Caerostris darwini]|uniref:Uncharacterized protein n=1 Tax=Caerostris darwini TaxID=1538125 RepID=A0AAV4SRG7_9ARAC|nr:hypothetical protein CDAR_403951 [Caerostris darwini]
MYNLVGAIFIILDGVRHSLLQNPIFYLPDCRVRVVFSTAPPTLALMNNSKECKLQTSHISDDGNFREVLGNGHLKNKVTQQYGTYNNLHVSFNCDAWRPLTVY